MKERMDRAVRMRVVSKVSEVRKAAMDGAEGIRPSLKLQRLK